MTEPQHANSPMRRLSVIGFVVLVIVDLALIQGLGKYLTRNVDGDYAAFTTQSELWRSLLIPVGLSVVLVYGAVAYLRWWRPVFVEERRVQRWVWALPLIMVVSILAVTNYGGLSDKGLTFTLMLLLGTMFVGFAEEGIFRGIGLTVFRTNGFTEGKAALWTCVIFGLAHATNIFSEGPKAFLQVLVTAVAGYFFYLARRVSGGLVVPAVLHGLWDFSLVSGSVVPDVTYAASAIAILADVLMLAIVVVRRKRIELPADAPTAR